MPDKITLEKQNITSWLKRPGRVLDIVGVLLLVFFGYIAWALTRHLNFANLILLAIIGFSALRIFYELTFNRAQVPVLPSGFFERRKIAALLQKDMQACSESSYTVIDLGSGTGKLTQAIARTLPQARVIGVELSSIALAYARFWQKLFGPANLEYKQLNFMTYDCSGAEAVVMFLSAKLTQQAGEKLRKELKSGALIIANEFELRGDWQPLETVTLYTPFKATLFVYRQS